MADTASPASPFLDKSLCKQMALHPAPHSRSVPSNLLGTLPIFSRPTPSPAHGSRSQPQPLLPGKTLEHSTHAPGPAARTQPIPGTATCLTTTAGQPQQTSGDRRDHKGRTPERSPAAELGHTPNEVAFRPGVRWLRLSQGRSLCSLPVR